MVIGWHGRRGRRHISQSGQQLLVTLVFEIPQSIIDHSDQILMINMTDQILVRLVEHAAEVKGILNSGHITEAYLLAVLKELSSGTTELYLHPGCLPYDEISRRMPNYRHEQELAALLSPAVKQRLRELDIRLCNYRGDEKSYV